MAEDDRDRESEREAEREAEITAEMERVGQNPEQVSEGSESLGTQSADSGEPRQDAAPESTPADAATSQEEAQELPDDQQDEQWEASGGDERLAREATARAGEADEADEEEDDEDDRPEWANGADANLAEDLVEDDQ